jgi:ABC-type nitrate/sulfonate/bicarbonate transport system ATPase subunit
MQVELPDLSRRNRKTVVMVTHSVEEAIALAGRHRGFNPKAGNDAGPHPGGGRHRGR